MPHPQIRRSTGSKFYRPPSGVEKLPCTPYSAKLLIVAVSGKPKVVETTVTDVDDGNQIAFPSRLKATGFPKKQLGHIDVDIPAVRLNPVVHGELLADSSKPAAPV